MIINDQYCTFRQCRLTQPSDVGAVARMQEPAHFQSCYLGLLWRTGAVSRRRAVSRQRSRLPKEEVIQVESECQRMRERCGMGAEEVRGR